MNITRTSVVSNITRTIDLPITEEQLRAYQNGMHVQNAFPDLDVDQREFIITGITAEEWDATFGEED